MLKMLIVTGESKSPSAWARSLVVVAGDDLGRVRRKLGNALEHVFGRVGREVTNQLVVNRQVGRQHKKCLMPCAAYR